MIEHALTETDCTKCNFMRRTDPDAVCPFCREREATGDDQ